MEVQVYVEIHIAISFGLEVFASVFDIILTIMEVIMENSFATLSQVMACVWCGIAFLRSSGERKFQPEREIGVRGDVLLGQE